MPTIDGRALLKIPPGTQSGQKLRLREKGVPSATREGVRGDEIVEITVTVPMPRDERTKELLRELAKPPGTHKKIRPRPLGPFPMVRKSASMRHGYPRPSSPAMQASVPPEAPAPNSKPSEQQLVLSSSDEGLCPPSAACTARESDRIRDCVATFLPLSNSSHTKFQKNLASVEISRNLTNAN